MAAKGAKAVSGDPLATPAASLSRNILLFSDGTGNSSGKLQKTNVWRLYEALDLGYPAPADEPIQIAYYDNGVGTSSFQLFAALGGIFGFGLARNIRTIYKFLCRNYRPGDRIYAFGFSRGAYTIRLLVALVCAMGLATGRGEEELDLAAHDVWRQARRAFHTNNRWTDLLVAIGRAAARVGVRAKRFVLRQPSNYRYQTDRKAWWGREWWTNWFESDARHESRKEQVLGQVADLTEVEVEFVGVWDTVAAYGGPFVELTRAIDEWIWPLTMPHYRLSTKVRTARHALAIDDKRDAFHPLLWDEAAEAPPAKGQLPRLQQVWFAGMHADVGGGYADESLSYVSLWWMIEHAKAAKVRLIPEFEQRVFAVQNVYGPLHDSRGGIGALYRYQPRYINAWVDHDPAIKWDTSFPQSAVVDHVQPATQIFRDPTADRQRYRHRGYLVGPVRLHGSVEQRLRMATDNYGPVNLPRRYVLDDGVRGTVPSFYAAPAKAPPVDLETELQLGDRIKLRRFWYFTTIVLAVLLALRPQWQHIPFLSQFGGTVDDRTNAQPLEAAVTALLPGFLGDWVHALFADMFTSLAVLVAIGATMTLGLSHERVMADLAHGLWNARLSGREPKIPPLGRIERFTLALARYVQKSDELQTILAYVKWRIVPFTLGLVLWLTFLFGAGAGLVQVWLARVESRPSTCPTYGEATVLENGEERSWRIDTAVPCTDLRVLLKPGQAYRVTIELPRNGAGFVPWRDGSQSASPDGWVDPHPLSAGIALGSTFNRRVVTVPLMAPILELRRRAVVDPAETNPWWFCSAGSPSRWCDRRRWREFIAGDTIFMIHPPLRQVNKALTPNVWEATITPPAAETGIYRELPGDPPPGTERKLHQASRLYAFVNDAVLPLDQGGSGRDCPRVSIRLRLLDLCGRYGNNNGYYVLRLRELDGNSLERSIDLRARQRCRQFLDRARCDAEFSRPPPG